MNHAENSRKTDTWIIKVHARNDKLSGTEISGQKSKFFFGGRRIIHMFQCVFTGLNHETGKGDIFLGRRNCVMFVRLMEQK